MQALDKILPSVRLGAEEICVGVPYPEVRDSREAFLFLALSIMASAMTCFLRLVLKRVFLPKIAPLILVQSRVVVSPPAPVPYAILASHLKLWSDSRPASA